MVRVSKPHSSYLIVLMDVLICSCHPRSYCLAAIKPLYTTREKIMDVNFLENQDMFQVCY
jgi:hypothetical protein